MVDFQILLSILVITTLSSCSIGQERVAADTDNILNLQININPSFSERATIVLVNDFNQHSIELLIKNNFRVDKSEDTFWFKKVNLTETQCLELDTSLVRICKSKIPIKDALILDGITISTVLTTNIDTSYLLFQSPRLSTDSISYRSTIRILDILKQAFSDNIISDYLSDVEAYINESKLKSRGTHREIDRKRMKEYNWAIPDQKE